jgi:hypothetical protein
VRLVAETIASLLGGRSVVPETVGFDHKSQIGPIEVDRESVEPRPGQRLIKTSARRDWEKSPFELGVGEDEGAAV